MVELSPMQRQVLGFIRAGIKGNGWAPSIREMCTHFKWASTHSAFCHLTALERKGAIQRVAKQARGIRVTWRGAL